MKPKRKPTTDTTTKGTDAMAYEIRNDHLPPAEQKAAARRRSGGVGVGSGVQSAAMSELNEIEKGQLCQTTIESFYGASDGLSQFPGLLKKIITNKAWERRVNRGKVIELASLRELITEKPIRGWGEDPKKIEAIIKDDPEALALYRDAMKCVNQHDLPSNNVTGQEATTGNSRAYSIDRVQRSCDPETVAKVMAGEMSPNAALVKAGIRENRQLYIPREPAKAVEKLRHQFGVEFVNAMAEVAELERGKAPQ